MYPKVKSSSKIASESVKIKKEEELIVGMLERILKD